MYSGQTRTFDFSKVSTRRYFIKHYALSRQLNYFLPNISANEVSKRYFGVGTSKVKLIEGEIGDSHPSIGYGEYANLYKNGSKYISEFGFYEIDDNNNYSFDVTGTVTIIMKKKVNSYYGWVVKSIRLTRY